MSYTFFPDKSTRFSHHWFLGYQWFLLMLPVQARRPLLLDDDVILGKETFHNKLSRLNYNCIANEEVSKTKPIRLMIMSMQARRHANKPLPSMMMMTAKARSFAKTNLFVSVVKPAAQVACQVKSPYCMFNKKRSSLIVVFIGLSQKSLSVGLICV